MQQEQRRGHKTSLTIYGRNCKKLLESYTWDREAEAETKKLEIKAVGKISESQYVMERG